jgi:hypothetical protein
MRPGTRTAAPRSAASFLVLLCSAVAPCAVAAERPSGQVAVPPVETGEADGKRHMMGTGPGGCTLEISTGPGSVLDKDELILKDYVDIRCGDLRLQADLVRYTPSTHQAHAEGNVVLDQAKSRITAESLDYNLESQTGAFINARGYAEPSILFEAAKIEQISPRELVLHDATFTACTQPTPYWSFKIGKGLLRLDDYAYLHDLEFKVGRATVFYSPYLVWPIKSDRASGLLFPEFGFSQRSGTIISEAWYWAMHRSMDATFYFDYMSKAGYGSGLEYRYVPSQTGRGRFTGYYIRDQVAKEENKPGVPVDRWVIDASHQQELSPEWRLTAIANFVSDFDYYLDFERDIRLSSNPQAISKVYLTRNWGFYSLNMWSERREQLVQEVIPPAAYGASTITVVDGTITRWILPEVEFRSRRQKLGPAPLFLNLEASFDNFDKGEPDTTYQRLDAYPVVSSQVSPVPWLDIDASTGLRGTYYTKSQRIDLGCDNLPGTGDFGEGNGAVDREIDRPDPVTGLLGTFGAEDDIGCDGILGPPFDFGENNGVLDQERTVIVDDGLQRNIYQAGLTMIGPKLSRIFDRPESSFSKQYKNSIEPTLRYTYLSAVEATPQIIAFDEVDIQNGNTNRLTYGLVTRLFAKRPAGGTEELAMSAFPTATAGGGTTDMLARALQRERQDQSLAEAVAAQGGEEETEEKEKPKPLSTVEIATLEVSQDYSFLGPLSVSGVLQESRPVSPIRGTLRINPSIYTSLDVRTSFDILFKEIREASLSANLRSPKLGFLDLSWTLVRDLEGRELFDRGLAFTAPLDRSQVVLQGETSLFSRHLLLGLQANLETGDLLPGEPRLRDQRYRAGYNTQCCGFQFEYLNRNFSGSDLREFRFLVNLKGVGNVVDLHQRAGGGAYP